MGIAKKKLQRIGNSTGLVLPVEILRQAGMGRGEEVLLHAEDGRLVITRFDPAFDEMAAAADRFVAAHPNALRKLAE